MRIHRRGPGARERLWVHNDAVLEREVELCEIAHRRDQATSWRQRRRTVRRPRRPSIAIDDVRNGEASEYTAVALKRARVEALSPRREADDIGAGYRIDHRHPIQ